MDERWLHVMCDYCWKAARPNRVPPRRRVPDNAEACCWCGTATTASIFLHEPPADVPCRGFHV